MEKVSPLIGETKYSQYGRKQIAAMNVSAAMQTQSIEFTCRMPISDTVFLRLKSGLRWNRLREFVFDLRPKIDDPVILAIDGHDEMYYGEKIPGIVGTQEKAGSFHAYKYLVAKIVTGGHAYIVDIREMDSGSVTDSTIEMVDELRKLYNISCVLMDGEFPSGRLFSSLKSAGIHYVCRFRSTATLRNSGISYRTPVLYSTVKKKRTGRPDTEEADFFIYRYKGRRTDFYLVSDMKTKSSVIRKEFRKRWRIETGFRDVNRVKIRTCTRNWMIRVFFYIVACLIYNAWIKIRALAAIR